MKGATPSNYRLRSTLVTPPPPPPPPTQAEVSGLIQEPEEPPIIIEQEPPVQQPLAQQPPIQQPPVQQPPVQQPPVHQPEIMAHLNLIKFQDERTELPVIWWSLFESYRQCLGMNEDRAIGSLPFHLTGQANLWFHTLSNETKASLDAIKTAFLERFQDNNSDNNIVNIRQHEHESGSDFFYRVQKMSLGVSTVNELGMVKLTINGLNDSLKPHVIGAKPSTWKELKDAIETATRIAECSFKVQPVQNVTDICDKISQTILTNIDSKMKQLDQVFAINAAATSNPNNMQQKKKYNNRFKQQQYSAPWQQHQQQQWQQPQPQYQQQQQWQQQPHQQQWQQQQWQQQPQQQWHPPQQQWKQPAQQNQQWYGPTSNTDEQQAPSTQRQRRQQSTCRKCDAALTFTGFEGTEVCMNFEKHVTIDNSVIKINNKENLPVFVLVGENNDWQLHLSEQYKDRIRTKDNPFNNFEFCILNVSRDDGGIFYWESVENITLNVLYGPSDILLTPELEPISVLDEHSSLTINCSADCNPDCQISWWKESKKLLFPVYNELVLTDVSRTDSGNYTCKAKNPEENNSEILKSLQIYVKYQSEMDLTPNQVLEVHEHNDINVSCNYASYPLSNALWVRNGERLNTTVKRKNEVVLYLLNNTCNNTGIYECSIFNNFEMKVTKLINLEVLCKPRFIGGTSKYTITKKIEGTIGEKIIMNEKVQANPAPNLKFVSQDVDVSFLSFSNTIYSVFISILISSESNFRWYSVSIGNSEGNITIFIEVEKTSNLGNDYKYFIGISVSFFAFIAISILIYRVIKRGIQNRGNRTESCSDDYANAEVVLQEIHSLIDYDLEDANLYENRVREIELAATESYENLAISGGTTSYEEMTDKRGMVKSDTSIERASTKAGSSETECSMKIDEDGYLIITDMTAMESSKERFSSQPKVLNISTNDDEGYIKMKVPGIPMRHNTI